MPYHSIVCVKQVPDTSNISVEAMKADGTVNRSALPTIFNPEDLHALEAALAIRDAYGGTVTALSMGPPTAGEVLRDCLYRGADRGVLITDRRAAGSDTLATSYILSQAVKTIGDYDFVFCGRQAIDGDTAQVGPQMAEKLGIPQITYFEELVDIQNGSARIRRNIGNGWEVLETRLPALVTVIGEANVPRPQGARRVMQYKRARCVSELMQEVGREMKGSDEDRISSEIEKRKVKLGTSGLLLDQWGLDEINADLDWCGIAGSPTKVHRVQSIVLTKEGYTEITATEDGVRGMIHELIVDRTLG